jgi:hypothetical protein
MRAITKFAHVCFLVSLYFIFFSSSCYAWDGHNLLTSMAVKKNPNVSHEAIIPAEDLTHFLQKEKTGLSKILRNFEFWSRDSLPGYRALPEDLFFNPKNNFNLQIQFMHAIRINPKIPLVLFLQYLPAEKHRIHHQPLMPQQVMLQEAVESGWVKIPNPPLERINPGELVSAFEILTTAVEEPDYGMDMNLFADNPNSKVGQLYQWGTQPFGNPQFTPGSQAPFHMGYFYESTLLDALSSINHSYVEYRIHLYYTLAKYAFRTGHPYWGYRFLGWSLHYLQDLTQPYHTKAAPNYGTTRLLFTNFLSYVWITSPVDNLIQVISNRHFSLENYVLHLALDTVDTQQSNIFFQALGEISYDSNYPSYSQSYARNIVAKESNEMADELDEMIRNTFPQKYVDDPEYEFFVSGRPQPNLYLLLDDKTHHHLSKFNKKIASLLRNFGSHSRNLIKSAMQTTNQQHDYKTLQLPLN